MNKELNNRLIEQPTDQPNEQKTKELTKQQSTEQKTDQLIEQQPKEKPNKQQLTEQQSPTINKELYDMLKASKNFINNLKKYNLRKITKNEAEWFTSASPNQIKFLNQIFENEEIRYLWNKNLITLHIYNFDELIKIFESCDSGSFMLLIDSQINALLVKVMLDYGGTLVLQSFSIEKKVIEANKIVELLNRKKWLKQFIVHGTTPFKFSVEPKENVVKFT